MAKARLKLVSDNTEVQSTPDTPKTAEVVKLDTAAKTKRKRTAKKEEPAAVETPVEAKKEETVTEANAPKAKRTRQQKVVKTEEAPITQKAPDPAPETAKKEEPKPIETAPVEAKQPEATVPATTEKPKAEEPLIVRGPTVANNILSAIMAFKTIYVLSTLNKKTGKLTATHYVICLVNGRNPTWGTFSMHGNLMRLRNSREEVERDYPRLVWRKKMSEFRLNNTFDLAVDKRRSAIEGLVSE